MMSGTRTVSDDEADIRLDRWFRRHFPGVPQSAIQKLCRTGQVRVDGRRAEAATRLLSFGCSRGDEVFSLRKYFPAAAIRGIDVDPRNIELCVARLASANSRATTFVTASDTQGETSGSYDAIFCLAVLCLGDLTASGAQRSDPQLKFEDFDRMVTDFARCLKTQGILVLHTTNFRFCDSSVAADFDVVLEADAAQLAPDVLFDRDNKLMTGARYHSVAFRKHANVAVDSNNTVR